MIIIYFKSCTDNLPDSQRTAALYFFGHEQLCYVGSPGYRYFYYCYRKKIRFRRKDTRIIIIIIIILL